MPPLVGIAVNETEAPGQTVVVAVLIVTDGVTEASTVMVTEFDVAVVGDAQAAFEVILHVTTAPLVKVVVVYVVLFVPTTVPFTSH